MFEHKSFRQRLASGARNLAQFVDPDKNRDGPAIPSVTREDSTPPIPPLFDAFQAYKLKKLEMAQADKRHEREMKDKKFSTCVLAVMSLCLIYAVGESHRDILIDTALASGAVGGFLAHNRRLRR
jgi:hypothetical protein